jgi:hypothetical protein
LEDLIQHWDNFLNRSTGPLSLRFILQPSVAIFLAIRAGIADAHEGKSAFLWSVVTKESTRWELVRHGFKDVGKIFLIAMVLDLIYQLRVLQTINPLETLFTAFVLAVAPYALVRGPVNRIATMISHHKPARKV